MPDLFNFLDFETIGSCNRTCPTCIRNSHPDRDAVASWFGPNYLEEELIYEAVEQAVVMGYRGGVCLAHYNEPLMDERLPRIAHEVRSYYELSTVHTNTNGDLITPELAAELDGVLDYINVSLYMKNPVRTSRAAEIKTFFKKTRVAVSAAPHMPTHFTPVHGLENLLPVAQGGICLPRRVIINHRRQYLLCCDDMIGNFDLGTFPEIGIKDYWFGKRQKIARDLSEAGGRSSYSYCMSCPKGAPWSI
ncbi:hypothetical protein LCGC14_1299310 [marine sediment metagenome]|uniref:Radical SAM core domain-containing protein n=1 Tax=marine sediment metagenome TaxID=412755 RepID=A0A0F9KQI0_9ZZZZ